MGATNSTREGAEESCSCLALREAARHVSRLYDEALAPAGLGVNQFSILAKLADAGPSALSDLALRLVMDRSTLGHLLRPLERRGLVSMTPARSDRRLRRVALTAEGAVLFSQARPLWREAERGFRRAFGAESSARLRRLLGAAARIGMADRRGGGRERATE